MPGATNFPLLLALIAAITGAGTNLTVRYVLKFATARDYVSINFLIIFLVLTPFAPLFLQIHATPLTWVCLLGASILDAGANLCYFKAFEINDTGTASALLATSPIFTLLLLPFFGTPGHNQLSPANIIGLLLTCAGIILLSRNLNKTTKQPAQTRQAAFYPMLMPLLSAFLFGSSVYLVKYILNFNLANPFSYYYIRAPLIAGFSAMMLRPDLHWITPRRLVLAAGRSFFVIAQWLAFLYAVDLGNAALVKAVSEVTPLFVLILSTLLFGEKLTSIKLTGAGLIVAGLITLSLA